MIINLCTTICNTNNKSETNIVKRINASKKILLALVLVHSTVVDIIFDISLTILSVTHKALPYYKHEL